MPGRTRTRQLRRQASQRQADKNAVRARRERTLRLGSWIGIGVLVLGALFVFLNGRDGNPTPTPTPTQTTSSSSASPTPEESPGTQVGTVDPYPIAAETACGDNPPAAASEPKPQFNAPAQVIQDSTKYFARFETSCGTIVVKLLPQTAPQTVNSFVFLAQQGYFDGTVFHRIDTSIDVIQGGDPTGTGTGGPGYAIPDELSGSDTYGPGVLAMANAGANTGGSQFFFIAGENGHLLDSNPAYTVFGEVVEGLDVLQRILGLEITDPNGGIAGQRPVQAVYIDTLTISNS